MGEAAAGQSGRGGQGRVDGHHFGVHGERSVRLGAAASTDLLHSSKLLGILLLLVLRVGLVLLALLQLGFHFSKSGAAEGAACDSDMLQCTAVEARTIVVVALTDDLAAAHNDTAMAIVQR